MIKPVDFLVYNKQKSLTVSVWFWAAIFRIMILIIPSKYVRKYYGISGEESPPIECDENYRKAWRISYHVNRVAVHTPWESKCLVRALTAQKLLTNQKISSTLYLGVNKVNNKMVAHSWIRTGEFCVTGGSKEEYVIVAKFRR